MVRNASNSQPQKSPGGKLGGINPGISRRANMAAGSSKSKGKQRASNLFSPNQKETSKSGLSNQMELDEESDTENVVENPRFISFDFTDREKQYSIPVTMQASSTLVQIELTVEDVGKPLVGYLKKMLQEAERTKAFDPTSFGTWLQKNQGKLSQNLGACLVPSLVSLRHHIQPQPLTSQKMAKAAVRNLLSTVGKQSLDLLSEYEQSGKFPTQGELTGSLMTFDQDKGHVISTKQHQ